MNTITLKDSSVAVASRWGELSRRDLLFLGSRFPIGDTPEFHVQAFRHFMQQAKWGGNRKLWRSLSGDDIYNILTMGGNGYLFGFIFTEPEMGKAQWRRFFHRGRWWHGPDHDLIDLTFGEFRYAEDCLNAFLNGKSDEALDTFIAVLWRPGWKKPPFAFHKTDRIAQKAQTIPHNFKCALLLQYIAMRGFLIAQNPGAFEKPSQEEGALTVNTGTTWGTLISALAQNITDLERIEHMNVWPALEWISNRKKMTKQTPTNEQ